MIRPARALPALLLIPALTVACGTEKSDDRASGSNSEARTADPAELSARATALGIAPEHVYTTDAPGYTLAQQSVGVYGGDGFSATYVSRETGAQLHLSVDRGTLTAENCPTWPAADASATRTPCTRTGDTWSRGTGEGTAYLLPKQGHIIRITGEGGTPSDALRTAADNVHRPTAEELNTLLPPAAQGGEPVERGDLPPVGDGAPDNDVNVGG
ncbi:hypothetical protein [Streptomyces sp. NPDC018693]|uniref:hypothetical protein n=1 Tax=unclassified Streptomyces TaxID=2593676 RepID=UPI00379F6865